MAWVQARKLIQAHMSATGAMQIPLLTYLRSSSPTSAVSDASAPDGQLGVPHATDLQLARPLTAPLPGLRTLHDLVLQQSGSLSLANALYLLE